MIVAVLSGFVLALLAPSLYRVSARWAGWVFSVFPAVLALYFLSHMDGVVAGEAVRVTYPWVPAMGLQLSFNLDGLGLLFALAITVVGTLIITYAGSYLKGHPSLPRFYLFILMFMASMLGVVLSDNLIALFVFWELTSVTSYFLIGFEHDKATARAAALQALLVTGTGGLALMAGVLLMGQIGGSFEISALAADNAAVQGHRLYPLVLALVFAGAFTKSAQVPFHFWLPSAMEAPTPVSAYLHSATMVKAGIYLLARFSPVLGGSDPWLYVVTGFGAATMLVSAYQALHQTDLKKILAYSTVSVLGTLTLLIGLGSKLAIQAAMVFLVAHVLYKAALFLVAGSIDHETGTRDIRQLGGLRKTMPIICAGAAVGALSMAGLPPFFGFVGKEALYEALTHENLLVTVVGVLTSMLLFAVAWLAGIRPFSGAETHTPRHPHDPPWTMWLGPVFLGCLSVLFGLMPALPEALLSAAAASVLGEPASFHLALWHGFSPLLLLSLVTFALGVLVYLNRAALQKATAFALPLARLRPFPLVCPVAPLPELVGGGPDPGASERVPAVVPGHHHDGHRGAGVVHLSHGSGRRRGENELGRHRRARVGDCPGGAGGRHCHGAGSDLPARGHGPRCGGLQRGADLRSLRRPRPRHDAVPHRDPLADPVRVRVLLHATVQTVLDPRGDPAPRGHRHRGGRAVHAAGAGGHLGAVASHHRHLLLGECVADGAGPEHRERDPGGLQGLRHAR